MTIESIAEKIVPTIIVVIIMAVFGMYMRIGYLEFVAENAVNRYKEDRAEFKIELSLSKTKLYY
jgi:hypothetical protein